MLTDQIKREIRCAIRTSTQLLSITGDSDYILVEDIYKYISKNFPNVIREEIYDYITLNYVTSTHMNKLVII